MKKILSSMSFIMILMFLTACGKKESSGGTAKSKAPSNVSVPVVTQAGQAAYNEVVNWYNSSTENGNIGNAGYFLRTTTTQTSGFQANFSLCLGGIVNIGDCSSLTPNGCYKKTNGTYGVGTPSQSGQCNIPSNSMIYTKASNSLLTRAVTGNGLKLISSSKSGSVYYLYYGQNEYQPTALYIINTSLHSLLNPIVAIENNQRTELKNFWIFY